MASGQNADSSHKSEDASAAQAAQSQTAECASGLLDSETLLAGETFPKALRLRTPSQFRHVFADATRFANRHWTFLVRPNGLPIPRLGLAIARKQAGKAHDRNRIKRIARECFRKQKRALVGYDIVILARQGVTDVDNATLVRSFEHLVRKIRKQSQTKDTQ